ncbi:Ig-like domain repeat protein [Dietzia aurantiaca]|uniref:Ig-like domain repeat protein n=1 Tax=Dietzia aurantiaca TaxID=983873 RepID=UPI001E440296|nr:Ig-like domain repeat protein [Dietzia aurantiaca]MCD2263900.1 Ig-like domain repeat protein [Dietzia aurantiaca]
MTSNCARETNLESTAHVAGTLGGYQSFPPSAFLGGPYIQVKKDATSVALAASPTAAVIDEDVTFTVTTSGIGDGETVAISGDGTGDAAATVNGNTATFTRSFDSTGTKNVEVAYAGSAIAHPAGPASVAVEVGKIQSTISIAAAEPAMAGSPVPLTASTTGIPNGEPVEFRVDGRALGTANVTDGTAIYTDWNPDTAGNYTIRAAYAGTATVASSLSPQVGVNVIDPVQQTSTTLAVDPAPVPGQASTLTATVTEGNDGDRVEFTDGGHTLGTATLDGGVASIEWTPTAGQANEPYSLRARYVGSPGYAASTSTAVAGTVGLVQTSVSDVAAPATATVGEQVQLSATVTGGTAGQIIEFRDGETVLDTVSLSSGGVATAYWTPNATGDYQVTAHYPGSSTTTSSSSPNATTVSVRAAQSTVTLTAPSTVSVGQATTLTADTTGIADGQSISFQVGGTEIGTGLVNNGRASYAWAPTASGEHQIKAFYAGTDTVTGSESELVTVEVAETATSTSAVTASTNPVTGEPVTLSAAVTSGTEGVDVVFRDGNTELCTAQLAADGTATCQWTPGQVGAVNVIAHYAGDSTTSASQSTGATTVTVAQGIVAAPSDLAVSPANPTAADTVTVSGTAPAGSEVSVYTFDGQHECFATADSSGAFSCELGILPSGQHQIQAFATLNGVMSQQSRMSVTVTAAATSIELTGPGSVQPGQAAGLIITTAGIADGEQLDITVDGTSHGTATVTDGAANYQWSSASTGTFEIVATYAGSDWAEPAQSQPLTISVDETATQTSNVTASTGATIDQPVTLAATVSGGSEGADVQFRNGSDVLCTGQLDADGTVECDWTPATAGTVTVRAHYPGDATTGVSQSPNATSVTVAQSTSTIALTATSPVEVNGTVTFELNTTGIADGQTVDITVGGAVVASPTVSAGQATATWTAPGTPGTLSAVAQYAGNATVAGSTSEPVSIEVGKVPTTISTVDAGPQATAGQPATLSATVTGGNVGADVEFRNGTEVLCAGQVAADGTVECPWTPTATGTVQVTAHYAGDNTTGASDSASATTITVVEAPDTEAPAAPTGITVSPQPATARQTVTVTGSAEADSTVSVMVDGVEMCEAIATDGTFECSFVATEGMDGQQVTVTATDAADNTSDAGNGGTLQVDPVVVDPTEPTITVTPAQPVAGQEVEIEVTGDAGEEVVIISGDREICRVTLDEDGNATCEWTPAAEGQTVLKVTVGDQTVEKTVTVRPAGGGGGDDNGSGSLDSGSLGSLVGGTGGTSGSLGSLSSLGG